MPRGTVIPGSIILGLVAATSQAGLDSMGQMTPLAEWPSKLKKGLVGLVPMKSLSDKEYEDLLQNKLLKVEAEISILDEQIADLRAASKQSPRTPPEQSKATPS